jgi:hypothetical protein
MATNARFIEWLYSQTEVVQVAGLRSRLCAADLAEFSIDGHEINNRSAGTQLHQANFVLTPLHGAAKRAAVEAKHCFKINNTQHKVINFANVDHGDSEELLSRLSAARTFSRARAASVIDASCLNTTLRGPNDDRRQRVRWIGCQVSTRSRR